MSAATHYRDGYNALATGHATAKDPGASGVIRVNDRSYSVCEVVTAGAESRTLDSAATLAPGTKCLVILKTDGGDLTIGSTVFTAAGDCAEFVVTNADGTKSWKLAWSNVT